MTKLCIESHRPVPPYLRLVAAVCLLEGLEDDPLLFGGDADASDRKGDDLIRLIQRFVVKLPHRAVTLIATQAILSSYSH